MITTILLTLAERRLRVTNNKPDFIIGRKDAAQVLRWYVIPRNVFCNIYLHRFVRSDQDFALHDHPWLFNASYLVEGPYKEMVAGPGKDYQNPDAILRYQGEWVFRWGKSPHRVMLHQTVTGVDIGCWTIFVTGPKVPKWIRQWGFYCPKGFVPFTKIVKYKTGEGSEPMDGCP